MIIDPSHRDGITPTLPAEIVVGPVRRAYVQVRNDFLLCVNYSITLRLKSEDMNRYGLPYDLENLFTE
jgi:hypothetical protein